MKLFILAIVAFSASMASAMTSEEYEDIRHEFFSQIKKNFKNNDCAKVLRLTFHDCVGGCDGCINIDNPHNAGLQDAIGNVQFFFTSWQFYTLDVVLIFIHKSRILLTRKFMKKFGKLCLHLGNIVQNSFHFDEIFQINKLPILLFYVTKTTSSGNFR